MIDTNPTCRTRAATHEAAHGVVAELCSAHPRVDRLWIFDNGGERRGLCEYARVDAQALAEPGRDVPLLFTQLIAGALAGIMAESLAFGGTDYLLDFEAPRRDEAAAIQFGTTLHTYLIRACRYSRREADREARARFHAAGALAEMHLRAQWGAVDRVAQALLECGTVPGPLVRTLIETAPQKPVSLEAEPWLGLVRRAEPAEPSLRGLAARTRERMKWAHCQQLLAIQAALEQAWKPVLSARRRRAA